MWRFRQLQAREIWATHGAWITATKPAFGPEIAERFDWVQTVSDAEAEAAMPERAALTARVAELLTDGEVLVLPTTPGIAPKVESTAEQLREHRSRTLSLSAISPLTRLPQIQMPLALVAGCPAGLSLIGSAGSDLTLLAFAEAFTE